MSRSTDNDPNHVTISSAPTPPPNASTILVLAHSLPSAQAFVTRLTTSTTPTSPTSPSPHESYLTSSDPSTLVFPWTIQNKYYKAQVFFRVLILEMEGEELGVGQPREGDEEKGGSEKDEGGLEGIPAVLYLLPSSDVEDLHPPSLLKSLLTLLEPDVTLAVRPRHLTPRLNHEEQPSSTQVGKRKIEDSIMDAYGDLGIDLVDEGSDERKDGDLPPLAQISQAFQAHMWPELELHDQRRTVSSYPDFPTKFSSNSPADLSDDDQNETNEELGIQPDLPTSPSSSRSSASFTPFQSGSTFAPFPSSSFKPSPSNTESTSSSSTSNPKADAADLTSTLNSLRALRDELAKVGDADERRILADKIVHELFSDEDDDNRFDVERAKEV